MNHSQDHYFLDCNFHHNDTKSTFFLIFLMLLTLKRKTYKSTIYFSVLSFLTIAFNVSIATWVYSILTALSGGVQLNPGPKNKSRVNFSICHWNLNSISAHNYAKFLFLKAYIAVYKFDIVYISETYLDTSITSDDGNLEILGYNLIRSAHRSRGKRGGICIYFRSALPLMVFNIHYLQGSINFELKVGDQFCSFIYLHRPPSQTQDEFENFSENLERNLDRFFQNNSFLVVVIWDFNVRSSNWYYHKKSSSEGNAVDAKTKQYGLQ